MLTLEKQQQVLEAKLVQKTEELQAATAQKAELAEQVQALTNSVEEVEEQCVLAIRASDQKLRRLQVGCMLHLNSAVWLLMHMMQ